MNITTKFTNNTSIENLVSPFTSYSKNQNLTAFMQEYMSNILKYSPNIKSKTTLTIDGDNATIEVEMS